MQNNCHDVQSLTMDPKGIRNA